MIRGVFRDEHPRVMLTLPGVRGDISLEFIADTGFAGDLAMPARRVALLDGELDGVRNRRLANNQVLPCPAYGILLDWFMIARPTEILVMEGDPLIGTTLLRDYFLQIETMEGGEVSIETL